MILLQPQIVKFKKRRGRECSWAHVLLTHSFIVKRGGEKNLSSHSYSV